MLSNLKNRESKTTQHFNTLYMNKQLQISALYNCMWLKINLYRNYEAFINEVTTDSVYREVKSVLLTELNQLKKTLPLYSNINKRIIENEVPV